MFRGSAFSASFLLVVGLDLLLLLHGGMFQHIGTNASKLGHSGVPQFEFYFMLRIPCREPD
jgi:hypothetical protein